MCWAALIQSEKEKEEEEIHLLTEFNVDSSLDVANMNISSLGWKDDIRIPFYDHTRWLTSEIITFNHLGLAVFILFCNCNTVRLFCVETMS